MRWVWFRPWPGGGHGAVFLWLALSLTGAVAVPPNDNFANGQLLTGAVGVVGGSNVEADKEAGEPDHAGNAGGHSVWYRWQANCSGTMTFDIDGGDFPALLAVYMLTGLHWIGLIGVSATAVLLIYQHSIVKADDLSRLNAAFFTTNAFVSVILFVTVAADIFLLS